MAIFFYLSFSIVEFCPFLAVDTSFMHLLICREEKSLYTCESADKQGNSGTDKRPSKTREGKEDLNKNKGY